MGLKYLVIIVVGYLLGSLNFSIIVSKLFLKQDIRNFGSGNAGSTNAFRVMGGKKTLLVMLGDMLKGILGALFAVALFPEHGVMGSLPVMIAGFSVVVGHAFPVYFKLRGGKGILTSAAVFMLFDPRSLAIILSIFLITVFLTRFVSLGSILAAAAFPVTILIFYPGNWLYFAIALLWGGGAIYLHRSNIKRLLAHNEKKFYFHRSKSEGDK
ncbi:MAG: glycerol-3-phosphate 1-O-acyltransferase PlsY [Ruminococcaceae bacterium]|nr:glycerol-3-phosphate 1-O-acyltransferase PlsY [Oscillospiraceae bacterium]